MNRRVKCLISWIVMLAMVWTMVPVHAAALTVPEPIVHREESQGFLNPLYEDLSEELYIPELPEKSDAAVLAVPTSEYAATYEEAAKMLREGLVNRQATIEVYYQSANYDFNTDYKIIFDQSMAHTGKPKEGDALSRVWAGAKTGSSYYVSGGITYATLTYSMTYYTTAEQEAELDAAVDALLSQVDPSGSDYEKLCTVYDYICKNITYDYTNLEDDTYKLKYTAYAALVNKTAVCQGYAVLLYRLALELGIDCRYIRGTGNGGAHGWNIVRLNGLYYNVDSTWDASWMQGVGYYNYFLQCEETFTEGGTDHIRNEEYDTAEFHAAYPMSETDFDPAALPGGICGENLTWELADGVLTISGTGAMTDFTSCEAPWAEYLNQIEMIVVENGATSLGAHAFVGCTGLTSVTLPNTLTAIGIGAFGGCEKLAALEIPAGVKIIGSSAFYDCLSLTELVIPEGVTEISMEMFRNCQNLVSVTIPSSVQEIGDTAFLHCHSLKEIVIPEGVTTIAYGTFMRCYGLESVTIPDSVTAIMSNAFYQCESLQSVTIPENVTVISAYAFYDCYDLSEVHLPDGITAIEKYAFYKCESLPQIELPQSLATIGEYALAYASALTSVRIPASVKQIDAYALAGDTLENVYFLGDAPAIGEYGFGYQTLTAYYPAGNATWTEEVMQNYGGTITWIPLCENHHYEAEITAPTCTAQGYTTYTCSYCGDSYVEDYVDALGHSAGEATVENRVEAGCEAPGSYDSVVYCVVCTAELSRETVNIPATGHSYGSWKTTKEPSCTEAGERERSCTACGKTEKETLPIAEHSYTSVITAPTCTKQGYTTYTCSHCGDSYVGDYVDALGHSAGNAVVENKVEAGCEAPGSYDSVVYCTVCTAELSRETVAVPATGHSYDSVITAPTCTEQGYTTYTCSQCGDHYVDDYVDALGHSYVTVVTAPTCTEDGYTTHTCAVCGHEYVDAPVDALGHDMGEWVVTEDATCTEPGSKVRYCSRCDHEQTEAVSPSGHAYNGTETAPTCTEDGYITYLCEYCGDSYTEKGAAKLGHDMGQWIPDGEGQERRECSRCDHYETREVEVIRPDAPAVKAANVASTGKIKLTWNAVDGAAKYKVYRSTDQINWTLLKTLTGTSLTNTSTTAGSLYYYYVVAVAEDGAESDPSTIISRRCDLARPTVTLTNVSSSGKIKITWKKIEGAVKYEVYRSTDKENWTLLKTTTGTSLTNTSTTAGKLYYYKVKAIASNSEANSAFSTVKSRRCDLAQPAVTLSNVASSGKIKISWKKIEGAVKYEVYRSTDKENWTLLKTVTGTSLTNTSTEAGKLYYYKVKAIASNSEANSAYSTVKSRTCDLARPTLTVTKNSKGQPYLSWTKVTGAVKYKVYRSTDGENWTLLKTTTGTKLTNSSVTSGTIYYYKVYAVASVSSANSAYSTVKSVTAG